MKSARFALSAAIALPLLLGASPTLSAPPAAKAATADPTLTVVKSGSGTGTVTSNTGLINCGATCSDSYPAGTQVTLSASSAPGSQFSGWLGPCSGNGSCTVTAGSAASVSATFAPSAPGVPAFDIDGNATHDALTDGLLIIRSMFGLTGTSLVGGAIGPGATRTTATQVSGYLTDIAPALDIDGNGQIDALTDGLLILRYLFGLTGQSLVAGAVGGGATHTTASDIAARIALRTGACLDGGIPRAIVRPVAGDLVINEVMPSPAAVADAAGEWFEVLVTRAVDLNGLGFERATGSPGPSLITTTDCLRAAAGSFLVFARSADPATNGGLGTITATFDFALPAGSVGTPADLRLVSGSTVLDTVTWTQSTSGVALQLDPDSASPAGNDVAANWCNATGAYGSGDLGTPGSVNAQCPVVVPPGMCDASGTLRAIVKPTAGQLVITEFLANPAGTSDATREWFEIVNTGGTAFDLNGLEMARTGQAGDVIASAACKPVAAGAFALFARSDDPTLNGSLPAVDAVFTFALVDTNGSIEVRDGATVLDAVAWTTVVSGKSRQLDPDFFTAAGNDSAANFCESTTLYGDMTDFGTPKAMNVQCP